MEQSLILSGKIPFHSVAEAQIAHRLLDGMLAATRCANYSDCHADVLHVDVERATTKDASDIAATLAKAGAISGVVIARDPDAGLGDEAPTVAVIPVPNSLKHLSLLNRALECLREDPSYGAALSEASMERIEDFARAELLSVTPSLSSRDEPEQALPDLKAAAQQTRVGVKDFVPFMLVVESSSIGTFDDGPPFVQLQMTPALLSRLVLLSNMAEKLGVDRMKSREGLTQQVWGSYGKTYEMEETEMTVYPGNSDEPGSFVISGLPHNEELCESRFISLDALIEVAGGNPAPEGFVYEQGVLCYSEEDPEELLALWRDDTQGGDQNASACVGTDVRPSASSLQPAPRSAQSLPSGRQNP